MNQVELTSDDNERRWKEANNPNKVSRAHSQNRQQMRASSCLSSLCKYTIMHSGTS